MVVTTCEAEEGDLFWVTGDCRWERREDIRPGQKDDEPLGARRSGRTAWDAVLG